MLDYVRVINFLLLLLLLIIIHGRSYHRALGARAPPPISGLYYFETELPM